MEPMTPIESVGDAHVVTLRGEIDAFTAPSLRDDLRHLVEETGARTVVVDLAAVTFLDSSALGALVGVFRRLRERNGQLANRPTTHGGIAHLRAHRARRRPRSLPGSGDGDQRSERVNRSRVPEPLARGPISTSSATARMIARPMPSSPRSSACHSATDSPSNPEPSSSTTTSSWSLVAQRQLNRDIALAVRRRRAGRRLRRPR